VSIAATSEEIATRNLQPPATASPGRLLLRRFRHQKLAMAGLVILLPGSVLLKEWAYAGATFTWMMATIAHYTAGEGMKVWIMPLTLLALLVVSYFTRPANRRLPVW